MFEAFQQLQKAPEKDKSAKETIKKSDRKIQKNQNHRLPKPSNDIIMTMDELSETITDQNEYYERRNDLLKDIDQSIIKKAWFTFSHLLLNENSKVLDMGSADGAMLFTMAVLNPSMRFIGVDRNKRNINKSKELYEDKVHNLEFIHGDVSSAVLEKNSIDAIISSYMLHEVYSGSKYNPHIVRDTLNNYFSMLKIGGLMYIRDYARPPPAEYVLMEMPDEPSQGDTPTTMTETDLLIWFAEYARPKFDAGCGGFFLEELPPRVPRTRLFRLPYKWAYEFIVRKDDRAQWDKELPMEYTFYTPREFRKELKSMGARVQYSGPYWDEDIIEDKFEGHFRLYTDDGRPLGNPPTCFIALAVKLNDRQSMEIEERRQAKSDDNTLKVSAMRNENTGELVDVVSRESHFSEILPYARDDMGRLKIYLHDGISRPVTNSVPRNGINIDGKRWSGHMIEPVSVDANKIIEMGEASHKDTVLFSRDNLGLKPTQQSTLVHGPDYYPAPEYIDDRIYTYYVEVNRTKKHVAPKIMPSDSGRFQSKGLIREFDAQQILNAIAVGMIPNARLELQILSLFEHLNLKAETWTSKNIIFQTQQINDRLKANASDILKRISDKDDSFKDIKGTTGQLRVVKSVFVEEGQAKGAPTGLKAEDLDFVISDEKTMNTAVVIPLTKGLKDDLHAGFILETLPVPQRHEGNGLTMRAPSFNIPKEVQTFKQLKRFIAEKMNVSPENVIRLGESYYNHINVTPQKIYPLAVAAPPGAFKATDAQFLPMHQFRLLWSALAKDTHFMLVIARAWQYLNDDIKQDYQLKVRQIIKERFEGKRPDWSIPTNYVSTPGVPSQDKRVIDATIDHGAKKQSHKKIGAQSAIASRIATAPASPQQNVAEDMHAVEPVAPVLSFHQQQKMEAEKKQRLEKIEAEEKKKQAALMKESAKETSPPILEDFKEMEKLVDAIEKTMSLEDPRPEKW